MNRTYRLLVFLTFACTLLACGIEVIEKPEVAPNKALALPPAPLESIASDIESKQRFLTNYEGITTLSGSLTSAGSDTLANLMTLWSEAFQRLYPSVIIQVTAAGSSTAPPALVEGTANFGVMSRPLRDREIEAFEQRYGYRPLEIRVAIDAVAIYVHKDNPIDSITLAQLDASFSVTRRCGSPTDLVRWGDFGLTDEWQDRPLQLYGRNSVSGTYGFFKSVALCGGDYKNSMNEQPGSASVVQAVATTLSGLGYSGVGHSSSGVKTLPLINKDNVPILPTSETAASGQYPLSRYFLIYVNKPPNRALTPIEREFLLFVLSAQGQAIVVKDGYVPISGSVAATERQAIMESS